MSKIQQFALSAFVALAAGPVLAAESSMPQMDQTWYPNQLVWLAICFVVLYVVVAHFIAPTVGGVLGARESAINEAIAKAEQLKATAANTRGDFEATSLNARTTAAGLIAATQAEANKAAADAQAKLAGELEASAAKATAAITAAKTKAQASVEDAATDLAKAMGEKLLGIKLDEKTVKAAVANARKA